MASLYRELKLLQRKYGRTKKGYKNREKVRKQVARFHNYIRVVRKDWQFKLAKSLCTKEGIGMMFALGFKLESYVQRNAVENTLLDAAFGQFLNLLELVGKKHQVPACPCQP